MPISEAGAIGIVSMAARILPAVTIAHIAGPVALTGSLILGAASLLNCRAADPAPSIGRRNWRTARRTEIPRIHMRPETASAIDAGVSPAAAPRAIDGMLYLIAASTATVHART